jgi:hypothetical protein
MADWWQQHLEETARWLVQMASMPGWVEHARFRAKELMASELYADLPRLMREAMPKEKPE